MENRELEDMRKSTTLGKVRIAVTIALVVCIFTPWLSGCGGPYTGALVIFAGVASPPSMIPAAISSGDIRELLFSLLFFLSSISFVLYPILNLWTAISRKGTSSWQIGSLIGCAILLILAHPQNPFAIKTGDAPLWGYALTWLVIWGASLIEVLDLKKLGRPVGQIQDALGIMAGIAVLIVAGIALVLMRPNAPPSSTSKSASTSSSFVTVREFRYQGEAAARKGDYDKAIENFSKAIELDPRNTDRMNAYSYLERGDAYYQKGSYDQAIADYNKLIEFDPKFQGAYHFRGKAYQKKGNLDRAMADFNKAIELDPNYFDCYRDRGVFYRQQGLESQAIADFEMYLRLTPNVAPNASDRAQVEQWLRELKGQ